MRGRPPVGLSFELIPKGVKRYETSAGSEVASRLESGRCVYPRPSPQKPNTGPTQALPWPLLARAYPYDPWESKGTGWEDAFTPESLSVCAVCIFWWDVGGWRVTESRGAEVPGDALSSVQLHVRTPTERVCDRKKEMEREREPWQEKSVILMVTFTAWESWVAARLLHYWRQSGRHQTDASACELYCHRVNDRCIFPESKSLQDWI